MAAALPSGHSWILRLACGQRRRHPPHIMDSSGATQILPDRFVFLGFQGGSEVVRVVGNPIPLKLAVGLDPSAAAAGQLRIENGKLIDTMDIDSIARSTSAWAFASD